MEWKAELKDLVSAPGTKISAIFSRMRGESERAATATKAFDKASTGAATGMGFFGRAWTRATAAFTRSTIEKETTKLGRLKGALSGMDGDVKIASGLEKQVKAGENSLGRLKARYDGLGDKQGSAQGLKLAEQIKTAEGALGGLKAQLADVTSGKGFKVASALKSQIEQGEAKVAGLKTKLADAGAAGKGRGLFASVAAGFKGERLEKDASLAGKAMGHLGGGAARAATAIKYVGAAGIAAAGGVLVFGARAALGVAGMARLQMAGIRLQRNLTLLFRGIDASALTRAADRVVAFFDRGSVSGRAIQGIFHRAFGSLFSLLDKAAPYFETFALGVVYGALLVENAYLRVRLKLLPLTNAISNLIGPANAASAAFTAGKVVMIGIAGAAGLVAIAMGLAALPFVVLAVAGYGVYRAVSWVLEKLNLIPATAESASSGISSLAATMKATAAALPGGSDKAKGAGAAIGDGMVTGMNSKLPAVQAAASALVTAADKGVTSKAEIRSPSRLFRRRAGQMGEGAAGGFADAAPRVERAARIALVPSVADEPARRRGGGDPPGDGPSVAINIGVINLGGGDPGSLAPAFRQMFAMAKVQISLPAAR